MTKATATFEGEEVRIEFSGELERHEEGDIVQNIKIEELQILGVDIDLEMFAKDETTEAKFEELEAALLEKADELEFTPIDSSDADDFDD